MTLPAVSCGSGLELSPLSFLCPLRRPFSSRHMDLAALHRLHQHPSPRPSTRHLAAPRAAGLAAGAGTREFLLRAATAAVPPPGPRRHAARAARQVACRVLPTGDPSRQASKASPPWSARAIKIYGMAELEARKLKYPTTGSEALLMGLLTEGTSHASKVLRAHGMKLFDVRDEVIELLGRADMYYSPPEHPPLTEYALRALDWAVAERERTGAREVTPEHVLMGIWAQEGSAGQQILAKLGFDERMAAEIRDGTADAKLAVAA